MKWRYCAHVTNPTWRVRFTAGADRIWRLWSAPIMNWTRHARHVDSGVLLFERGTARALPCIRNNWPRALDSSAKQRQILLAPAMNRTRNYHSSISVIPIHVSFQSVSFDDHRFKLVSLLSQLPLQALDVAIEIGDSARQSFFLSLCFTTKSL